MPEDKKLTLTVEEVLSAITQYLKTTVMQGPYFEKWDVKKLTPDKDYNDGIAEWTVTLTKKPVAENETHP